jgi:serine/threonine protein kinase/tetratricopeptide (TPR) repeat protein
MPKEQQAGGQSSSDPAPTTGVAPATERTGTSFNPPQPGLESPTISGGVAAKQAAARLARGQVLAGRYELIRFIAHGGMGEVYEARDRALRGTVALKTIRASIAENKKAVDRFLREIHLARQVTHPNVCRIFDFHEHAYPSDAGDPIPPLLFLTMELLSGETLSERLVRGRPELAETLDLLKQIAAGLDAAHAVGIVHRDFKCSNVMLVPSSRGGVRAVITDFGLARTSGDGEDAGISISDTGDVVGTPAYMAPEQVEGKPVTAAADLYSLGIVIYEMVTGQRPFTGGSAMSVALKRLQAPPAPPTTLVPDLDPRWERAILRCLEREPERRFARALDIVAVLEGRDPEVQAPVSVPPPAPPTPLKSETAPPRRQDRLLILGALVAVVAGLALWAWRGSHRVEAPPIPAQAVAPAPPAASRRSVAVLGLKNVSGQSEAQWIATGVSEMLASDLASGELVRVLSGQQVAEAKLDVGILPDELPELGKEKAARLHAALTVEDWVTGSYTVLGPPEPGRLLHIDLRLQEGATGAVLASGGATGTQGQLFDLVARASGPLREKLGLPKLSAADSVAVAGSLPADPVAAQFYSEGLGRIRAYDALGARDLFEKAVLAEPNHPLPHAALAGAWLSLGYDAKADAECKKAASLAGGLPREQKLGIEALSYEVAKDWDHAIERYRDLASVFPDNIEYGLRLARVQASGGKVKEALVTLGTLRKLSSADPSDPRIDLENARASQYLGDSKEGEANAAKAAAVGTEKGMRTLVARAKVLQASALVDLGQFDKAKEAADAGRALAESIGDRREQARAIDHMGYAVEGAGDLDGASRLYDRALGIARETGDLLTVARLLLSKGLVLSKQGRGTEAQQRNDEALATFRKIGAKKEAAGALNNMGVQLQLNGELGSARRRYQEALALLGEVGDRSVQLATITNIGEVDFTQGSLSEAEAMYRESLALCRETGEKVYEGYNTFRLGELQAARGDLGVAEDQFQTGLKILKDAGDHINESLAKVAFAKLRMDQGRAADAEPLARDAEQVLRSEGAADGALQAKTMLGTALLEQGKQGDAREASDDASARAQKSDDRGVRLGAAVLAARVQGAGGSSVDAALKSLEETATEASQKGFAILSLEARLAAGEIEWRAHRRAVATTRLQAVVRDAKAHQLGQIAARASAILTSSATPTKP